MKDDFSVHVDRLSRVTGVRGALIVDARAGVPIVAELAEDVDGPAVAALAASLFTRTENAAQAASFGGVTTVQLEAENGHLIVVNGKEVIAVAVTDADAQLGRVRLESRKAVEALQ